MKKLFVFLLLILTHSSAISFATQQDPSLEEIDLKNQNNNGDDRGIISGLSAYQLLSSNSIFITFPDYLGVVVITVLDSTGNTVYYAHEDTAVVTDTMFLAPTVSDSYLLQIQSPTFSCIGFFSI